MAINVNTVYTTVLSILNKEQRGYLTPFEFNKLAVQVQLEVFEKYFEDLNVQLRSPQNNDEYADRVKSIEEKIDSFLTSDNTTATGNLGVTVVGGLGVIDTTAASPAIHRFGDVTFTDRALLPVTIEKVSKHELSMSRRSQFAAPTSKFPMCFIQGSSVNILPAIASSNTLGSEKVYEINYVKKPSSPNWSFTTGTLGQYVYDSANSVNFEISDEDQSEVILRILTYAGVVVRDTEIIQAAAGAVSQMDQQQQQ
jgi:hypothetical protein